MAGRGLHAVAHLAEQEADFEPWLLQMLQERGGEGALAIAIVRDIVLARGVGDQLVAFEQGGRGQAAPDGAFRASFAGARRAAKGLLRQLSRITTRSDLAPPAFARSPR